MQSKNESKITLSNLADEFELTPEKLIEIIERIDDLGDRAGLVDFSFDGGGEQIKQEDATSYLCLLNDDDFLCLKGEVALEKSRNRGQPRGGDSTSMSLLGKFWNLILEFFSKRFGGRSARTRTTRTTAIVGQKNQGGVCSKALQRGVEVHAVDEKQGEHKEGDNNNNSSRS